MYFSISAFPPVILSERSILSGLILLVLLPASSSNFRIYPPSLRLDFFFLFFLRLFAPQLARLSLQRLPRHIQNPRCLRYISVRRLQRLPNQFFLIGSHRLTKRRAEFWNFFQAFRRLFPVRLLFQQKLPLMSLYWSRALVSSTMLMP